MLIKSYLSIAFVVLMIVLGITAFSQPLLHWSKDAFAAIQSIVSIIAVVVGAVWAYDQFVEQRERDWNVQLRLEHRVLPHSNPAKATLIVDVYYKNLGKRLFNPGNKGMNLSVGKVPSTISSDQANNTDGFGTLDIPNGWDDDLIVSGTDLLYDYRGKPKKDGKQGKLKKIVLEPGSEFHEVAAVVVPKNTLLMVLVELFGPKKAGESSNLDEQILVFSSIPSKLAPSSPVNPVQRRRGR